jgi:predicted GIY-YIG superfamily endonuclease
MTVPRTAVEGTIYLLHFTPRGYRHAAHYLGWTEDLATRLDAHRKGRGARLMEVIAEAGLGFVLARTWTGTRALERRLKGRGGHARLCPICRQSQGGTQP